MPALLIKLIESIINVDTSYLFEKSFILEFVIKLIWIPDELMLSCYHFFQ